MDTSEFARILDDTVIRSDAPFQEQVSQNEKLYGYAQNIMPEKLFRYRKCNERSIDAFYRDQVGVSSSISMYTHAFILTRMLYARGGTC